MIRLILVSTILLLIFVTLVGIPVAYVFWMVKTWRRGRIRLFRCQTGFVGMAVAALVFLFDLTPASHWFWEWQRMKDISGRTADWTGVSFAFAKKVFLYDSERCWNGDGYSLIVLELTPEIARYFSAPPPEFFAKYPKKPDYRARWQAVKWHTGPIRADEKVFTDFVFMDRDARELKQLEKSFADLRRSLAKPTTHYAYFHQTVPKLDHTPQVCDIDFFVIDPEEGLFYFVNFNT